MTKEQLKDDLKKSMLAKDELRTSVLRMLLSAINYYEIQKGGAGYEATDEDVMQIIQQEAKKRKDAIEHFEAAGRYELVGKELKEQAILEEYLPEQMSEEEVKQLVDEAIKQTGAVSMKDLGKVMRALMPSTRGKADGSLVSKLVKEKLS